MKDLVAQMTDILSLDQTAEGHGAGRSADAVLTNRTRRLNRVLQKQVMSKAMMKALQEPLITVFLALGIYVDPLLLASSLVSNSLSMVLFVGRVIKHDQRSRSAIANLAEYEGAYWSLLR